MLMTWQPLETFLTRFTGPEGNPENPRPVLASNSLVFNTF